MEKYDPLPDFGSIWTVRTPNINNDMQYQEEIYYVANHNKTEAHITLLTFLQFPGDGCIFEMKEDLISKRAMTALGMTRLGDVMPYPQ